MNKSFKSETERRLYPRAMAPVYFRIPRMPAKRQRVSNLSLRGVRIYSDERLDIGQELNLEFFLPNRSILEVRAKVVWLKELPLGSQGVYDVGLEFLALPKKARKELGLVLKPDE